MPASLSPKAIRWRLGLTVLLTSALVSGSLAYALGEGWQPNAVEVLATVACTALLVGWSAVRLVESRVVRPLRTVVARVDEVAPIAGERGADERRPTDLGTVIEEALERVEASRRDIVRCARLTGMSDVSSALLHGVGNTMNGVLTSVGQIDREVRRLSVKDVHLLIGELKRNVDDLASYLTQDRQGRFVLPFLTAMAHCLDEVQQTIVTELASVDQGVREIAELMQTQERYIIGSNLAEVLDPCDDLNQVFLISQQTHDPTCEVTVERHFEPAYAVQVDRHRLHGVLLNMLQNAFEALESRPKPSRRIILRVYVAERGMVAVEVVDSGIGIASDLLERVFESGFTTKEGARGLGLHVAANSAREMGGFLQIASKGNFQGTTQILQLPAYCDQVERAAPSEAYCATS